MQIKLCKDTCDLDRVGSPWIWTLAPSKVTCKHKFPQFINESPNSYVGVHQIWSSDTKSFEIKLWEAPESMRTTTLQDMILPRTFIECGEQNPTREDTQSAVDIGPLASSSLVEIGSHVGKLFSVSSSSSITHNTYNDFCLQRWLGVKRSSHKKQRPLSPLACTSRFVSLLKGGGTKRGGRRDVGVVGEACPYGEVGV